MKIGIEGQRLFRKNKHGMDVVALELIKNLQSIDKHNQYVIFIKPDIDSKCLVETDNFQIVRLSGWLYPIWEQYALLKAVKTYKCDILHCTSNTAPVFTKIPLIITLHDIIYMESMSVLKKAGTWYQKFGNLYRRIVVPIILKKSKKIITVSNYERQRIADFFKIPESNRLKVVYNGVGEHFKKIEDLKLLAEIKKKYNLPNKFIFHLGNTDPKKNTKGVLKAYSEFLKINKEKIPLVMLDFKQAELFKILKEIGEPDLMNYVHLIGYVLNTDLPAIYSQCEIFLYPSLRESFGIPILEAMACGTPVITSNTSSMPEISGDAAILINPFDIEEITKAIINLLNDDILSANLIKKGFQQAQKFSWKSMAQNVLSIYNEVNNSK